MVRMANWRKLALSATILVVACFGLVATLDAAVGSQEQEGKSATYLEPVVERMRKLYGNLEPAYFDYSKDNSISPGWIVAMPEKMIGRPQSEMLFSEQGAPVACSSDHQCAKHGLRGQCAVSRVTVSAKNPNAVQICQSQSQNFINTYYDAIVNAKHSVDLVYLGGPDGRLDEAIRNALSVVADSGKPMLVRILAGIPEAGRGWDLHQYLVQLRQMLPKPEKSKLIVQVARMGSWCCLPVTLSWTHSKILLIDGERALVGGQNLTDGAYLSTEPTFDLSVWIEGGAAESARKYVNALWQLVRERNRTALYPGIWCDSLWEGDPQIRTQCDFHRNFPVQPRRGTVHALAVAAPGRPFAPGKTTANPSRDAFSWLVPAAKKSIKISQQDIVWGPNASPKLMPALALRALEGIPVYMILTNPGAPHGMSGPGGMRKNGLAVMNGARSYSRRFGGIEKVRELLCRNFNMTTIQLTPKEGRWTRTNDPIGNHAKSWIIDDTVAYVGSDNFYDPYLIAATADHQEFGVILEDRVAVGELASTYFDSLWDNSKGAAVSGSQVPPDKCIFRLVS